VVFSSGRRVNLSVSLAVATTVEVRRLQECDDGDTAEPAEEQMGRAGEMERRVRFKLTAITPAPLFVRRIQFGVYMISSP
jgi:hypothetical protein